MPLLPVVEKSVCGCDLKSGTLIIGWFALICRVLSLLLFFVAGDLIISAMSNHSHVTPEEKDMIHTILIVVFIIIAIGTAVNLLMVIGAHQERPGFMLPFIILSTVYIVGGLIILVIGCLITRQFSDLIYVITYAIDLYLLIIVNSYYEQLKGSGGQVYSA